MIICICKNVNEQKIRDCNTNCLDSISRMTGACTQCKKCKDHIEKMVKIVDKGE